MGLRESVCCRKGEEGRVGWGGQCVCVVIVWRLMHTHCINRMTEACTLYLSPLKPLWHSGNSMLACSCSPESNSHPHMSSSQRTELTTDLMDGAEKQLLLLQGTGMEDSKEVGVGCAGCGGSGGGGSRSHWWPYQTCQTQCRNYPSLKCRHFPDLVFLMERKDWHLTAVFIVTALCTVNVNMQSRTVVEEIVQSFPCR